jgi:hypothetical protein
VNSIKADAPLIVSVEETELAARSNDFMLGGSEFYQAPPVLRQEIGMCPGDSLLTFPLRPQLCCFQENIGLRCARKKSKLGIAAPSF